MDWIGQIKPSWEASVISKCLDVRHYKCLNQDDGVAVERKKKEEWAFLLLFPENKEDKENREKAWTYCFLLERLLILYVCK